MGDTTKQLILNVAPELKVHRGNIWDVVLADVAQQISATIWGRHQEAAQRYLAAHMLTVLLPTNGGKAHGPVTSERVGQVQQQYADTTAKGGVDGFLNETVYGRMYLQIRARIATSFAVFTP